jgi:hypothetical protein
MRRGAGDELLRYPLSSGFRLSRIRLTNHRLWQMCGSVYRRLATLNWKVCGRRMMRTGKAIFSADNQQPGHAEVS